MVVSPESQEERAGHVEEAQWDLFISYSTDASGPRAAQIQRSIEQVVKNAGGTIRCFRDETSLALGAELSERLADALTRSANLVVLLSPEAQASRWVDLEIRAWIDSNHDESHLHLLKQSPDTVIEWDSGLADFTADSNVPDALRGVFRSEPIWADVSTAEMRRREMPRLVASVLERPVEEILQREVHEERRRRRRVVSTTAGLSVLLVVALLATVVAYVRQGQVASGQRISLAQSAAAHAADNANLDPVNAIEEMVGALEVDGSDVDAQAHAIVDQFAGFRSILDTGEGYLGDSISISPDGEFVSMQLRNGTGFQVWDVDSGRPVASISLPKRAQWLAPRFILRTSEKGRPQVVGCLDDSVFVLGEAGVVDRYDKGRIRTDSDRVEEGGGVCEIHRYNAYVLIVDLNSVVVLRDNVDELYDIDAYDGTVGWVADDEGFVVLVNAWSGDLLGEYKWANPLLVTGRSDDSEDSEVTLDQPYIDSLGLDLAIDKFSMGWSIHDRSVSGDVLMSCGDCETKAGVSRQFIFVAPPDGPLVLHDELNGVVAASFATSGAGFWVLNRDTSVTSPDGSIVATGLKEFRSSQFDQMPTMNSSKVSFLDIKAIGSRVVVQTLDQSVVLAPAALVASPQSKQLDEAVGLAAPKGFVVERTFASGTFRAEVYDSFRPPLDSDNRLILLGDASQIVAVTADDAELDTVVSGLAATPLTFGSVDLAPGDTTGVVQLEGAVVGFNGGLKTGPVDLVLEDGPALALGQNVDGVSASDAPGEVAIALGSSVLITRRSTIASEPPALVREPFYPSTTPDLADCIASSYVVGDTRSNPPLDEAVFAVSHYDGGKEIGQVNDPTSEWRQCSTGSVVKPNRFVLATSDAGDLSAFAVADNPWARSFREVDVFDRKRKVWRRFDLPFDADSDSVAISAEPERLMARDLATNRMKLLRLEGSRPVVISTWPTPTPDVSPWALSYDGRVLATGQGNKGGKMLVFDAEDGSLLMSPRHTNAVELLRYAAIWGF